MEKVAICFACNKKKPSACSRKLEALSFGDTISGPRPGYIKCYRNIELTGIFPDRPPGQHPSSFCWYGVDLDEYGNLDSYTQGEIYPDNFENFPQEGVGTQLYFVDHFFREQRIKQNRRFNPSGNDKRPYQEDHEVTLAEQIQIFGYTQDPNSRKDPGPNVIEIDYVNKDGEYIETMRVDTKTGKPVVSTFERD
ncbi:MAG: hypothetical protein KDC34_20030 [Saprospiraceae bacterium]|nr:hypothetical protein [Saprospiraceae bacterium]